MKKSTLIKNDTIDNQIRELKYLTNSLENVKLYIGWLNDNDKFNVRIQSIIKDIEEVKIELNKTLEGTK
tara:strand:- start:236 stop:442 length:207 start_codon:yes stop_codon:yes gene_type:complete